ncbi:MAG: hypothetical protein CMH60_03875 [Myxococcales bacterium]|nr:hypothetical protein [Myxococcales bacterium]
MENDQGQIYLFRRISELALISEGIVNALEGQDYRRFDILIQQSRKLKATVRELKKTVTKFDTDSPEQEKEVHDTLKEYLEKINAAEVATHRHIEGLVQTRSRDELLSTPEGCAVFAEILLPASWDLEQGLVGIIGSGGHFLAQKLQERGQKRILIYDPSHDPENSKYPEGVMIAQTNIDIAELCSSIQGAPSTMHITSRSPDPNISDSEYNEIAELFREGVTTHQIMQNTVDRFGEYWVTHSIENIPYIIQHPSLKQLERAVRGRPLIMASPGPSLDKNIDELYKIQNKAVICCISQCVGKLISKGIKPDFVFAADPQNLISHFEKVNGDNVGALVLAATVNPKLYRVPATRFITMAANGQSDEWLLGFLGQQPNTSAGGSVACSVFALSAQAKCHPIILVGQDLAFSEGRRYAEEASKAELSLQFSEDGKSWVAVGEADKSFNDEIPLEQDKSNKYAKLIQLPGYYGETVNTSEDYKIFWNWFAKSATNLKD